RKLSDGDYRTRNVTTVARQEK
ncbi:cytoplasmic protein, partial [Salmonella enterica]|nr:cytoplasmic protein [Salmonella enterica]